MSATRAVSLAVASAIFLVSCENDGLQDTSPEAVAGTGSASIVAPAAESVTRDVERPDIFATTESALWDGRPSLGGIWVAHPDVTDPERVRITNTANGQEVSGALFRRERNNPGPRIQVSSDAAEALAMLAGQPAELSIVVMRTEEIEITPPPVIEGEPLAEPAPGEASSDGEETAAIANGAAVAATVANAAAPDSKPGFWQRFRRSLSNKPAEPEPLIVPVEVAEDASVPEVETGALDPVVVATAAIEEAEAETAAPRSALKNPFVQVGLFKLEANANAAAASLRQAGIVPEVKGGSNASGPYWRVIVGPMATADDQAELLAQVKSLGYRDAFLTAN